MKFKLQCPYETILKAFMSRNKICLVWIYFNKISEQVLLLCDFLFYAAALLNLTLLNNNSVAAPTLLHGGDNQLLQKTIVESSYSCERTQTSSTMLSQMSGWIRPMAQPWNKLNQWTIPELPSFTLNNLKLSQTCGLSILKLQGRGFTSCCENDFCVSVVKQIPGKAIWFYFTFRLSLTK